MVFKNTLCTQQHHSHCRFCLCDSDLAYTVNLSPLHMNVSLLLQWCFLKLICSWQRISQSALEECGCFHTCLLCCSFMLKYKIQMYLSWKKFGTARPLPSVGQLTKLSNQGEHVFRDVSKAPKVKFSRTSTTTQTESERKARFSALMQPRLNFVALILSIWANLIHLCTEVTMGHTFK